MTTSGRVLTTSDERTIAFFDSHDDLCFEQVVSATVASWELLYSKETSSASCNRCDDTHRDLIKLREDVFRLVEGVKPESQMTDLLEKWLLPKFDLEKVEHSLRDLLLRHEKESEKGLEGLMAVWMEKSLNPRLMELKSTIQHMSSRQEKMTDSDQVILRQMTKMESQLLDGSKKQEWCNKELSKFHADVQVITSKFQNSSTKGAMSENMLYEMLTKVYPSADILQTGQSRQAHMGDLMFQQIGREKILIENKCYENKNVPTDEVQKFLSDCSQQNCSGIMVSQHSGISMKANFSIETTESGHVYIYLHNVFNDMKPIQSAIHVIENYSALLRASSKENSVDKEKVKQLRLVHADYLNRQRDLLQMMKENYDKQVKLVKAMHMNELAEFFRNYEFHGASSEEAAVGGQKRKQDETLLLSDVKPTKECPYCHGQFALKSKHFKACAIKYADI
jgi:hypothetical protein